MNLVQVSSSRFLGHAQSDKDNVTHTTTTAPTSIAATKRVRFAGGEPSDSWLDFMQRGVRGNEPRPAARNYSSSSMGQAKHEGGIGGSGRKEAEGSEELRERDVESCVEGSSVGASGIGLQEACEEKESGVHAKLCDRYMFDFDSLDSLDALDTLAFFN